MDLCCKGDLPFCSSNKPEARERVKIFILFVLIVFYVYSAQFPLKSNVIQYHVTCSMHGIEVNSVAPLRPSMLLHPIPEKFKNKSRGRIVDGSMHTTLIVVNKRDYVFCHAAKILRSNKYSFK